MKAVHPGDIFSMEKAIPVILCGVLCLFQAGCANPYGPDDQRPVQFWVHEGYSVKGTFDGEGSTTCLVFRDKASFDNILYWIANHNPYEPVPDADFQTKVFPVVIKKGNSFWTMGVDSVCYVQKDKTLYVYYRATLVADNMSWVAIIPLVLSIQTIDYLTVRFYQNGEFISSVPAASF
jgi:hypothetical protein